MFILTQDNALVELSGTVRADETASYDGSYRVIVTRRGCTIVIAQYETKEEANNCVIYIAECLSYDQKVCSLLYVKMDDVSFNEKVRHLRTPYSQAPLTFSKEDTEFWK